MGKNQRHKKNIRLEKSKVKLKTKPAAKTKFLPKGANVTDTNFKIKPIVVQEQLKLNRDEPLTKKKLNFKDLMTRLNHHNSSAKYEACEGLIELINSSQDYILEIHLYTLIHGVCKLLLDIDTKVRQRAIKLVSDVIERVVSSKLAPFYDILTSYVLCAMTHIDKKIQEDSLLIIDAYLRHAPLLLVQSFDKILTNFLTLISKLRNDAQLSRTLTINLNSKITSTKWRIRVLVRLRGILEAVVNTNRNIQAEDNCATAYDYMTFIPVYKGTRYVYNTASLELNSKSQLEQYVSVIIPLLHETWAEVMPLSDVNKSDHGTTVIPKDAASVLSCVVGIFYLFWKIISCDVEKDKNEMKIRFLNDGQKFLNHILSQFPFRQREQHKQNVVKDMKLLEVNSDPKCVKENLLISYMFCVLYKTFPNMEYFETAQGMLGYLKICMVNRNYIKSENIELLTLILRVIFFENSKTWSPKNISIEKLLDTVVHFYNNLSDEYNGRIEIFNLLCDIVGITDLRSQKYEFWLASLPLLLCKPEISCDVIDTLSLLSRQNNQLFLTALLENLPNILENLPKIKIYGITLLPSHLKIINMLYYIPMNAQDLESLQKFGCIQEGQISKYIEDLVQEKKRFLLC